MKNINAALFILLTFATASSVIADDNPMCTRDETWKYVINNAYRVADKYASDRNPQSIFISSKQDYSFVKQYGGDFEGSYLLMLTNKHGNNISFAVLYPLFDVNKPSTGLNDEKPLWKIINAKFNGIGF